VKVPRQLQPGSVWERHTAGELLPETITIVTASTTSDTFGRISVTYSTGTAAGRFYGLVESWNTQFRPVPSD
jgi:hypothetical protein